MKTKEIFRPENTILEMSIKDAYKMVREEQFKLSVAVEQNLPKDINLINKVISCKKNKIEKDLNQEEIRTRDNIQKLEKQFYKLIYSKHARIVAVHRVITNKGFRSPGISSEKPPTTNEEYLEIVEWLREILRKPIKYQTSPLDRIYLIKTNKTDKMPDVEKPNLELGDTYSREPNLRPISIPSIKDRCLQALYYIGYSVYSEFIADRHSYGFRPGRSPAWSAQSIAAHLRMSFKASWVLEVDISKCYDKINHDFIINNTPFIPKEILEKWLKQGYIIRIKPDLGIFPTESGIPQGGIISPAICNTVLDGAEDYIRKVIDNEIKLGIITPELAGYKYFRNSKIFILFRFADDIIILAKSKFIANRCKMLLEEFLNPRGLELSDKKTHLTDISGYQAKFIFVGYQFRKDFDPVFNKTKWYIEIPENNLTRIKKNLTKLIRKKSSVEKLFYEFNLKLRGWVGYYATANASHSLKSLNRWVFQVFYQALSRRVKTRHDTRIKRKTNKKGNKQKVNKKYIYRVISLKYLKIIPYHGDHKMLWYSIRQKKHRKKRFILFSPIIFKLINQKKNLTKMGLNFYNQKDITEIQKINLNYKYGTRAEVLKSNFKKYNSLTCESCNEEFNTIGKYEFHHKTPVEFGGKTIKSNLKLLCKPCHNLISTAVASRKLDLCLEWINTELLEIPENYLNIFN